MESIVSRRKRLLGSGLRQYYDVPFHPVRGEGVWLHDADGRIYLDAYNNVPHVGHCHPHVVAAIHRQAATLNTNTRYLFDSVLDYAERLTAIMPRELNVCLFTCTGSEANDLAWRLARAYTGNDAAITIEHAYHGNTTFLDLIDGSTIKQNRPEVDWWETLPAPDLSALSRTSGESIEPAEYAQFMDSAIGALRERGHRPSAFFLDTFFCADGVHLPPTEFMSEAFARLREAGGVCIADEIQAGLGRIGDQMWGFERLGFVPDMVTLGKPMGNGHPIGIVVAKGEIAEAFFAKDRYFNTFAGNPVSCAAGIAVLDVMERERLQQNAGVVGKYLVENFKALSARHEIIGAVRGQGLLLGVELVLDQASRAPAGKESRQVINEMCRRGVLIGLTGPNRQARNVLKIRPPLVFDKSNVDQLVGTLDDLLGTI
jgi:4-aminobutyrate aminotransferase-like enzyme